MAALGDYYNLRNAYISAWHIKIHTCYCYNSGTMRSRCSRNVIRNFSLHLSASLSSLLASPSQALRLTHPRVAPGNSSLRYYQFSSPSKKTHLFLSISSKIPAKWIPLVVTRLHAIPEPITAARGTQCLGRTSPLCSHGCHHLHLDHMD